MIDIFCIHIPEWDKFILAMHWTTTLFKYFVKIWSVETSTRLHKEVTRIDSNIFSPTRYPFFLWWYSTNFFAEFYSRNRKDVQHFIPMRKPWNTHCRGLFQTFGSRPYDQHPLSHSTDYHRSFSLHCILSYIGSNALMLSCLPRGPHPIM